MGDVFYYAGACLLSHYVATAVSSGSKILALSKSVNIMCSVVENMRNFAYNLYSMCALSGVGI
jgi:hypothetical protein